MKKQNCESIQKFNRIAMESKYRKSIGNCDMTSKTYEYLNDRLIALTNKEKEILGAIGEELSSSASREDFEVKSSSLYLELLVLVADKNAIQTKIDNANIIDKVLVNDENQCEIGDVIVVVIDDEVEAFELIDTNEIKHEKANINFDQVSIQSPIGMSVYHKMYGEKFSYLVNDKEFNGFIDDIIKKEDVNKIGVLMTRKKNKKI